MVRVRVGVIRDRIMVRVIFFRVKVRVRVMVRVRVRMMVRVRVRMVVRVGVRV